MTANVRDPAADLFRLVCDMENPLSTVCDLLRGLAMIAEALDRHEGSAVQRIAWIAMKECEAAEELRGELFRLAHPNREELEKEGGPGDAANGATA